MLDNHSDVLDNAGGGLRGLRAKPSTELFEAVRHSYGVNCLDDFIDLGGSSSLNLLISDKGSRYVVRLYRPYLTAARLTDVQLIRRELNMNGVPSSEVLPTRDGQQWIIFDGRLLEVERYVESDAKMDSLERLTVGLPFLGRVHTILRDVKVSTQGRNPIFANHIESQNALARTLQGCKRIRGWKHPSSNELQLADAAQELARLVSFAERDLIPVLPRQLVHGDFWDNNVFFHQGRVALVTDFDYMGERARIDDLALTLYFTSSSFSNDPVSVDWVRRLRSLIDVYDEGLDVRLSSAERAAIPLAMARQPLWSIGGWIALLDDEQTARRHAEDMLGQVEWALRIIRDLDRWQAAFT